MKKLLIVEDDAEILEVVQMILLKEGYDVRCTSDSAEVLMAVEEFEPDLVILDLIISGNDGLVLCSSLKSKANTAHIPIIIFSAHPQAEKLVKQSGADSFIPKPFNVSDFLGAVRGFTN